MELSTIAAGLIAFVVGMAQLIGRATKRRRWSARLRHDLGLIEAAKNAGLTSATGWLETLCAVRFAELELLDGRRQQLKLGIKRGLISRWRARTPSWWAMVGLLTGGFVAASWGLSTRSVEDLQRLDLYGAVLATLPALSIALVSIASFRMRRRIEKRHREELLVAEDKAAYVSAILRHEADRFARSWRPGESDNWSMPPPD